MGEGTGIGMLEKWCALPNFSFEDEGGIAGWTAKPCNACHIGSDWNVKGGAAGTEADCTYCHHSSYPMTVGGKLPDEDVPTIAKCMTCHYKDTAKRGDVFDPEAGPEVDVHIAAGMLCQDCHERRTDAVSDHQFLKGTAMDTTEPTMKGTMSCTMNGCHLAQPHNADTDKGVEYNAHIARVACETCHTGLRPAKALASRKWNVFKLNPDGLTSAPLTTKRDAGWLPVHKWYDNTGPGASGDYHLPILGHTERRELAGAKIYPFNPVTVDWFVKKKKSAYDDVIIVPEVKAADRDGFVDGFMTVTVDEMQDVYRKATLLTADMNFSISHSVPHKEMAFKCGDCHGRNGWVLDWKQLGYARDPRGSKGGGKNK
jgi:methanogenesis multiheme c-type cytochrome